MNLFLLPVNLDIHFALTWAIKFIKHHRLVLSLEVQDDGPGIPQELQDTIFYPLVTGRSTGTGLGLTIAQFRGVCGNGRWVWTSG